MQPCYDTLCDNPTTRRIGGIPTERNALLGTGAQHMNLPARAAVASVRNDRELQDLIDAGNIHWHQLAERDPRTA